MFLLSELNNLLASFYIVAELLYLYMYMYMYYGIWSFVDFQIMKSTFNNMPMSSLSSCMLLLKRRPARSDGNWVK